MRYQVIVGNIGTVYDGPLFRDALEYYAEYKQQSRSSYGRASGESVTLFDHAEVLYETQRYYN